MRKRIALLSLVLAALVAVPAATAARHDTPKPGTPAALAAKLRLKVLAAEKFTRLYSVRCHVADTPSATPSQPSRPILTLPVCTKTGHVIVGGLQQLDRAIQAKLAKAKSGSKAETLLRRLDARLQTVLSHVQVTIAAPSVKIVPISPGTGGNA